MDEKLKQFTRETLIKSMLSSEEWFDKNLTFIAGGAILLSVSFLDKLVPYKDAICKWTLIAAWFVLMASLVLNLLAHRRSSLNQMTTLNELDEEDELNAFEKAQERNRKMNQLTLGATWSMATGLLLLIIYCSINLYNMPEDKKAPNTPDKGKFTVPSYVPNQSNPTTKQTDYTSSRTPASQEAK
jgi:hypothetical protein